MNYLGFVSSLAHQKVAWVLFLTYFIAHLLKFFLHYYRFKTWSVHTFFQTGGMPSSHTATTTALTIAIAYETGPSLLFIASALFTLIIIRDSYGVRKSVSDQAHIINALTSEMKVHRKAKIVLGHTPFQVFVGFVLGALIPIIVYSF